jgi:hypothetical protein
MHRLLVSHNDRLAAVAFFAACTLISWSTEAHGAGNIGQPCTVEADCAVGTCQNNVCCESACLFEGFCAGPNSGKCALLICSNCDESHCESSDPVLQECCRRCCNRGGFPGCRPKCVGDCEGVGRVTIADLTIGTLVGLGERDLRSCPSFDSNEDSAVSVDELITGVKILFEGCPEP